MKEYRILTQDNVPESWLFGEDGGDFDAYTLQRYMEKFTQCQWNLKTMQVSYFWGRFNMVFEREKRKRKIGSLMVEYIPLL